MTNVGIIGASGFTGAELLRLAARHRDLDVVFATGDSQAGNPVASLYPSLAAAYPDTVYAAYDPSLLDDVELVFLGLPHGASQAIVPELVAKGLKVVDLAADFRLADPALYPTWYGEPHAAPELLSRFAYGLPELFRSSIVGASLVASPGCYPTTAALALAPALAGGFIETSGIVVDAASGVSGAGRAPKPNTTFTAVDEDFTAYGLLDHRHTPEIEQSVARVAGVAAAEVDVLFTPHLAPMNRGILATCYARPNPSGAGQGGEQITTEALLEHYAAFYADEPFVVVSDRSPSTKASLGSNTAHVTVRSDPRTGWIVAICALDNLAKGASSQAVQCANIMLGLDEATGLDSVGVYP